MDKHLKEVNFEEKVNTFFTPENKQSVLEKINKIEQKRNKKPHYFQNALTIAFSVGLIIFGFAFISNNLEGTKENAEEPNNTENELNLNQNAEDPIEVLGTDNDDNDKKRKELKVGGYFEFWDPESLRKWDSKTDTYSHYDYSDSNYNLYVAHLRAAAITDHTILMGYTTMNDTLYKRYLDSILFFLKKIEPGEDKLEKFQKAIQLAEQSIENNVEKGDPILDELHEILHELDEYYNAKPFLDDVTNQHGMQFNYVE